MTASEKRKKVVEKLKTRVGKNKYTQGARRTQVGSGYGDCSATVRWAYMQVLKVDIGGNTEGQITNSKLKTVDTDNGSGIPDEKNLKLGDLIYFRGKDDSRYKGVGHVEMYIGNGKICGHGSGIGPTIKDMKAYCKTRKNTPSTAKLKNRGYICAKRYIQDDVKKETTTKKKTTTTKKVTKTTKKSTTKTATIIPEKGANVRSSKSAENKSNIIFAIPKGKKVTVTDKGTSWSKIKYDGKTGYIMTKLLKF